LPGHSNDRSANFARTVVSSLHPWTPRGVQATTEHFRAGSLDLSLGSSRNRAKEGRVALVSRGPSGACWEGMCCPQDAYLSHKAEVWEKCRSAGRVVKEVVFTTHQGGNSALSRDSNVEPAIAYTPKVRGEFIRQRVTS